MLKSESKNGSILFAHHAEQVLQQNYALKNVALDDDFYESNYWNILQSYTYYGRNQIDKMFIRYKKLRLPIGFEPLEYTFSGFNFYYYGYDNSLTPSIHGGWETDSKGNIVIKFANNCILERQRFTIAHELMHFFQDTDPYLKMDLQKITSKKVRRKVIERIADILAGYYLVPEPLLRKTYHDEPNIEYQAHLYKVSKPVIEICLNTYKIISK